MAPKRLSRPNRKGASLVEYSLLLALLGGTSVTMVLYFGQTFIAQFSRTTNFFQDVFVDAGFTSEFQLELAELTPPGAATGAAFTFDMSSTLNSVGAFEPSQTPFWTALDLPPGLTMNASTGVVSGTPTTGGTYNATITVDRGDASVSRSYTFVVT